MEKGNVSRAGGRDASLGDDASPKAFPAEVFVAVFLYLASLALGCSVADELIGARVVRWENHGSWVRCSNRPRHEFAGHWIECSWPCALYQGGLHSVVVHFPVADGGSSFGPETATIIGSCGE